MVRVVVNDTTTLGVRRNDHEWDAGAVAEVVHRLNVSRVVVAAALIEGDEDRGVLPQSRIGLDFIDDFLGESFKQVELGGGWVAIYQPTRLDDRDRR